MVRKTISFIAISVIFFSCGNTTKKEAAVKAEITREALKVEFASLIENPENYIGKEISVQGKVVHVCTQSGKKMFITGENPDVRLFVSAGEEMPKFPMELLGSEIVVEGTLTRPEATAMAEGEGMQASAKSVDITKGDTCETEKALAAQPVLSELMMVYNKHTLVK